jgi:hypothetical protein
MSLPLATVVEWGDLLQVVYVSLIAGVGITAVWSAGLVGVANFDARRRAGERGAAFAWGALAIVAGLAVAAAVVEAVIIMTTK